MKRITALLVVGIGAGLLWVAARGRLLSAAQAPAPGSELVSGPGPQAAPPADPAGESVPPPPLPVPPLRAAPHQSQGKLVRERDGQLYQDFPDGRRVLHTTVRMRDATGREWDEPVEIEATPVDPRKRDEPRR